MFGRNLMPIRNFRTGLEVAEKNAKNLHFFLAVVWGLV
jgi:hypothetical protein